MQPQLDYFSEARSGSTMQSRFHRFLLLALAYFATGWLGLQMPFTGSHITLVWLPTGIAVAALFRWGWTIWPGVFIGAFLVNLSIGSSLPLAAGIAVGNTLGPVLAARCLKRLGFHAGFDRQRDVGLFILAAALGMALSAAGGIANLFLSGLMPLAGAGFAWLAWWMGDTVGVLLAAPFLLTLARHDIGQLQRSLKEVLFWILLAGVVAWLSFFQDYPQLGQTLPLAFLTLPVITGASLRFGIAGAALSALGFSVLAAWSTASGHGAFFLSDEHISLFLLWAYMATTVVTGLFVTALQTERFHVERHLRESEEKLRGLFDLSPLGIALTDMKGHYIEFNEAFLKICGYPPDELKALDYWTLTPEKYKEEETAQLERLAQTGLYGPYEKAYVRKDGSLVPLRLNGMLVTGKDGQKYIWSIVENIADHKRMEADLRVAATAFEAQVGIMVTDADTVILRVNQAFIEDSGYSAEEILGRTPSLFRSGRHDADFYAAMWQSIQHSGAWQGEIWDRRKNGEVYPKWMTITSIKGTDGVVTHYVSTQIDITERKTAEDEIRNLAFYDPLTCLPNRRLLLDRLHQALVTSRRNQRQGAILFIDLDNFKTLNDTLGHDKGDLLLQLVAQRLSKCVRQGDTVARLGGDEFVILLEDLSAQFKDAAGQAENVADKILFALNQPYQLGTHEYHSTPSIGITLFGTQYEVVDELLKQADLAMYQAKAMGRNTLCFFDPEMQVAVTTHMLLEKALRSAIRENQFVLYYQPQVDIDRNCTGAEALVRWQRPEHGIVFPDEFIPIAEESGLILALGQWVMESACTQLAAWATLPAAAHLTLAVNVSAQQLHQADFVGQLQSILAHTGADPTKLKLEITESSLLSDAEDVIAKMTILKAMGVGFALDDFGTGYSSLSYLKRLPLEKLKIDRSFVMDVLTDPSAAAIARTIVTLAQSLGHEVIAEGVETEEQRAFLAQAGCNTYQGYLFSRAVPFDEFERFLASTPRRPLLTPG